MTFVCIEEMLLVFNRSMMVASGKPSAAPEQQAHGAVGVLGAINDPLPVMRSCMRRTKPLLGVPQNLLIVSSCRSCRRFSGGQMSVGVETQGHSSNLKE